MHWATLQGDVQLTQCQEVTHFSHCQSALARLCYTVHSRARALKRPPGMEEEVQSVPEATHRAQSPSPPRPTRIHPPLSASLASPCSCASVLHREARELGDAGTFRRTGRSAWVPASSGSYSIARRGMGWGDETHSPMFVQYILCRLLWPKSLSAICLAFLLLRARVIRVVRCVRL